MSYTAIVDYGVGNLFSLSSSLKYLNIDSVVTNDENKIKDADRVILPGVGAFGDAMAKLSATGLIPVLNETVSSGKPVLGICLGMQMLFEKSFDALYLPIVVLANPKTYLNAKYARKDIKDKVLRADQLVAYIEKTDAKEAQKSKGISTEEMRELAEFFLSNNKADRSDYAQKYEELLTEVEIDGSESDNIKKEREEEEKEKPQQANFKDNVDRNEMVRKLKAFRLEQSRKENVKPYYIFKDAQMNDLIDKMPKNKEELLQIQGFGSVKVEKYGDAILTILDS